MEDVTATVNTYQGFAEDYLRWAKEVEDYFVDHVVEPKLASFLIHYKSMLTCRAESWLARVEAELNKLEAV